MQQPVHLSILDRVEVASPCTERWEDMEGDERSRFCGQCRLRVYNLTEMSAEEAAALVEQTEGRLCVRFYRRADGTMLTRDCPVGLRAVRARLARGVARLAAAVAFMASGAAMLGFSPRPWWSPRLRQVQPFATLCEWLSPKKVIVAPPAPPGPPATGAYLMGARAYIPRPTISPSRPAASGG